MCTFPLTYLTDDSERSGLSGAEWEDNSIQGACHYIETRYSPTSNCRGVPQGSTCGPRQEPELSPAAGRQERLPRGQDCEEEEGEKNVFILMVIKEFVFTLLSDC